MDYIHRTVLAAVAISLMALPAGYGAAAQQSNATDPKTAAAAAQLAEIFSQVGDQIYEECIFELSPEQVEVQQELIKAYIEKGASSTAARQLAVRQIQPPKLSSRCERIRQQPSTSVAEPWETTLSVEAKPELKTQPKRVARNTEPEPAPEPSGPVIAIKDRDVLPRWDCAPNIDYVTVHLNGFQRKLSGGEICKPYKDVVIGVPESVGKFRLGYVIATGRLFVDDKESSANGKSIAWAISGRDVCRNNPDPECLASRGVGSLPPGEYSFAADPDHRITWGPKTKRNVVAIYLRKLWNRDKFTKRQTQAILRRGNIAIHMRLKGEMSEACIGMEPKGWSYVASLVKQGRATGVNVYLDEPHPQIAEAPPLVEGSSFSLTSLFQY